MKNNKNRIQNSVVSSQHKVTQASCLHNLGHWIFKIPLHYLHVLHGEASFFCSPVLRFSGFTVILLYRSTVIPLYSDYWILNSEFFFGDLS